MGNLSDGLLFIVSAPAGTGKTTLVRLLIKNFPCLVESVSCTTRPMRAGEEEGRDYFFMTHEAFEAKKNRGDFLESAKVFGHWYGTSKDFINVQRRSGKHVILVIDTQGALYLQTTKIKASYIFIAPPNFEVLQERLLARKTENEEERNLRLSWSHRELDLSLYYDFFIVNSELEVAYEVLKSILISEEHRVNN